MIIAPDRGRFTGEGEHQSPAEASAAADVISEIIDKALLLESKPDYGQTQPVMNGHNRDLPAGSRRRRVPGR
jgi:hypothetical protein